MSLEKQFLDFLALNAKDDAAVLSAKTVCASDSFVQDSHFRYEWFTLEDIVHKALSVNVSDMYIMGAIPDIALLSISLPYDMSSADIHKLARAIRLACDSYHIRLVGGDTIASSLLGLHFTLFGRKAMACERFCVSVPVDVAHMAIYSGLIESYSNNDSTYQKRRIRCMSWLLRKGICYGDILCISGNVGNSLKTLRWLLRGVACPYSKRHQQFYAKNVGSRIIPFVKDLLHASIDISDGLGNELERLSLLNHCGFYMTKKLHRDSLHSGEEYEALVAVNARNLIALLRRAKAKRTRFIPIARAIRGRYRWHGYKWH